MNYKELIQRVIDIAKTTGQYILNERQQFSADKVESKSFNNLVSYVDKTAEKQIIDALKKLLPESGFIAEEQSDLPRHPHTNWIIDPLDGTTNFIHGIPCYAVSIALHHNDEVVLGVIYECNLNECFYAYKEGGAYLNGNPISVSETPTLEKSLIATGFPYDDFEKEQQYFDFLKYLTHQTRGIRRLGSAAADMAYVACGRFDVFYEYGLNPWDVAAGIIIVQEAGGKVTDFKGGNNCLFGEEIIAGNKMVHERIVNEIQSYF